MKYLEIKNGSKAEKFRLKSEYIEVIENKYKDKDGNKMTIAEILERENQSTIKDLLMYMRKFEDESFDEKKANDLYDELVDSGWTLKKIIVDIVYETLVISGFLEKAEWEEVKKEQERRLAEMKALEATKSMALKKNRELIIQSMSNSSIKNS